MLITASRNKVKIYSSYLRIGAMVMPISHADPTEFKFTLLASHVVAPLILFNPRAALGTWFGIRQNPVGRLRLILALFVPSS
jgi:hypothetical protein